MKRAQFILVLFALIITTPLVFAADTESGFFMGAGANALNMIGNGSWDGYDFEIDSPLTLEDGSAIGFNWSEKLLVGIKPFVGYKISEQFSLQASYNLWIPKASTQSYGQVGSNYYYEQSMTSEWKQRTLELTAYFYPMLEPDIFVFAGINMINIQSEIILFEGIEIEGGDGSTMGDAITNIENDEMDVNGFVFGAGTDLPLGKDNLDLVLSVQYSTATTDHKFYDTDDFKVKVGGFSFLVGLKWFPMD